MSENATKLSQAFSSALEIDESLVKDELSYESIPEWDSVAHMALVAALENAFDVMLDTNEILDMSSVAKAKEILSKHDVDF